MSDALTYHLNLNHIKNDYLYYILREAGWNSLQDYMINILAINQISKYETFPIKLKPVSIKSTLSDKDIHYMLESPYPIFDPKHFLTTRLMFSNTVDNDVVLPILKKMGIDKTEFELSFPENNFVYITIPYKEWFMSHLKQLESEKENSIYSGSDMDISEENDSSDFDPEEDYDNDTQFNACVVNTKPLCDFEFVLNKTTMNSYILYRENGESSNDPQSWKPFPNYRSLFYSEKYKGYIVGLDMYDELLTQGATYVSTGEEDFEDVD